MKTIQNPQELRELVTAFQKSRIFLTAFELKIFTVIGENMKNSKQISREINADERATDRLLNALCAIGLLRKTEGKFTNTDLGKQFLIEGKDKFMSGFMHTADMFLSWSTMTQAVKNGTSITIKKRKKPKDWAENFIAAMHHRAKTQAPELASLLDLQDVKTVLDIGGGSGIFSMEMIRKNDHIRATIFDLPDVTPITLRYIEQAGLSEKMSTLSGNYINAIFENRYDLILLSAIVHINSYQQNEDLVKSCADALQPGGQLVIQDFVMDDNRITPERGAIFALNMLVGTESGDTYTQNEITEWMQNAGLVIITRQDTSYGSSIMTGYKP